MKHIIFSLSALVLTSTFTPPASGDVQVAEASFIKTWVDSTLGNSEGSFAMKRSYNSRSLYQGIFGFGWCSSLESMVIKKTVQYPIPQTYFVQTCGLKDLNFSKVQRTKKGIRALHKNGDHYLYTLTGQLIQIQSDSHPRLILKYDLKNRLSEVRSEKSRWIQFLYAGESAHVQTLITPMNTLSFTYMGDLLLRWQSGEQKIKLRYDDFDNLIEIRSSQDFEKMTYNDHLDQLISYENSEGCRQQMHYARATTTILESCPGQNPEKKNFDISEFNERMGVLHEN